MPAKDCRNTKDLKEYVDEQITNIDLSDYATNQYVDDALEVVTEDINDELTNINNDITVIRNKLLGNKGGNVKPLKMVEGVLTPVDNNLVDTVSAGTIKNIENDKGSNATITISKKVASQNQHHYFQTAFVSGNGNANFGEITIRCGGVLFATKGFVSNYTTNITTSTHGTFTHKMKLNDGYTQCIIRKTTNTIDDNHNRIPTDYEAVCYIEHFKNDILKISHDDKIRVVRNSEHPDELYFSTNDNPTYDLKCCITLIRSYEKSNTIFSSNDISDIEVDGIIYPNITGYDNTKWVEL